MISKMKKVVSKECVEVEVLRSFENKEAFKVTGATRSILVNFEAHAEDRSTLLTKVGDIGITIENLKIKLDTNLCLMRIRSISINFSLLEQKFQSMVIRLKKIDEQTSRKQKDDLSLVQRIYE
jgi:hypothetical protein